MDNANLTNPNLAPRFRDAFELLSAEIRAVPESEYLTLNLGIADLVTTVLGAWPKVWQTRAKLAELPGFDLERFDRLEAYALALGHAQTAYKTAAEPPPSVAVPAAEALQVRQVLLSEATTLVARGVIAKTALGELRGINGYKNIAFDLLALSNLLRKTWNQVSACSAITRAELDAAESVAQRLLTATGRRQQAWSIPAEVVRDRLAAFTLLVNAYNEVRTAVAFVCRKRGEADAITPSLYKRRVPRRKAHPCTSSNAQQELLATQGM